jgi:F-type H+-transporting ATPase subunit delta
VAESGNTLAAKRYARAAFELASQTNDFNTWEAALDQIAEFMSEPEVKSVLENTRVAQDAKLHLIDAALNDLPLQPLNLAKLLAHKRRTDIAPEIAAAFQAMVQEQSGIQRVHASNAVA